MRDTCVPKDSEVVKRSALSGRRVFTASYSLSRTEPSFPICTSFNKKLTCRLKGVAGETSRGGRGGGGAPPSRWTSHSSKSTSRSRVAILASFVSRSTRTVLLEGEGTSSSCDCRVRKVSLAARSSCTNSGKQRSLSWVPAAKPNRFTTTHQHAITHSSFHAHSLVHTTTTHKQQTDRHVYAPVSGPWLAFAGTSGALLLYLEQT